ncbi:MULTISPECIES: hypothetical protein, partial [unclassified Curtobacterium]|uniref:hypothetical protein n=1 Tax=unclassified Curtobacterium TaxID=257496 RepID=UPI003A7FFD57
MFGLVVRRTGDGDCAHGERSAADQDADAGGGSGGHAGVERRLVPRCDACCDPARFAGDEPDDGRRGRERRG